MREGMHKIWKEYVEETAAERDRLKIELEKTNQAWACDKAALKEGWENANKYEQECDRLKEEIAPLKKRIEELEDKIKDATFEINRPGLVYGKDVLKILNPSTNGK